MPSPQRDLGVEGIHLGDMLKNRADASPQQVAYQTKHNGVWQDTTWKEAYQHAQRIAYGLLASGLDRGDRVALLAGTRKEWSLCDFGILLAGGATVPLYPSNTLDVCLHILRDSGASVLFVENAKQWERIHTIRSQLPALQYVVIIGGSAPGDAITLEQWEQQGAQHQQEFPNHLVERASQIHPTSLATIAYTSGTTGMPKGVLLTHEAFVVGTRYALGATPAVSTDVNLMFLPMAHIFGHMLSIYAVRVGFVTAFAESLDKLGDNLAEIKPTCLVAVPRVFEKVYNAFMQKVESGGAFKRGLARWALRVGQQASQLQQRGQAVTGWLWCKYKLADALVFRKLRQRLGGQLRWFISGSAPLATEIMEFFHMAGMMILEGYGLTETTAVTTVNRMDRYKFGTVGLVHHADLQIRIAEDGEILTRGVTNFIGYHNLPEATHEAIDADGWFHTGDIGTLDPQGFLSITDRKKDLIKTSAGKWVAPQVLEGKLKLHPLVNQVLVIGDRHQYITALFTLHKANAQSAVGDASLTGAALAAHPLIQQRFVEHVAQLNQALSTWEQIKYFRVLPEEWSEAAGEVTPSLKIKRKVVVERYKSFIDEMYDEHVPHPERIVV